MQEVWNIARQVFTMKYPAWYYLQRKFITNIAFTYIILYFSDTFTHGIDIFFAVHMIWVQQWCSLSTESLRLLLYWALWIKRLSLEVFLCTNLVKLKVCHINWQFCEIYLSLIGIFRQGWCPKTDIWRIRKSGRNQNLCFAISEMVRMLHISPRICWKLLLQFWLPEIFIFGIPCSRQT